MKQDILKHLSPAYPWAGEMEYFPAIGSTNDALKLLAKQGAPHGTALIAGCQTNGHGRMGRSFLSPEGAGVYLSFLIRPECKPQELMHLTCAAAVAMCDAVESAAHFVPGIKWTNDLVYGKRKLGGILTELGLGSGGTVDYAIIGIGINCCQNPEDFATEIRDMAGSLSMATGQEIDRARVAAAMLEALAEMNRRLIVGKEDIIRRYRERCVTIGQEISLVRGEEIRHGKALDVDTEGALIVEFADGHREAVNSGEVSIRGMYGYL